MTLLGSASALGRTLACPASGVMQGRDSPSGEAAKRGSRIHRFLELAPENPQEAFEAAGKNRQTCEKLDITQTAGYYTPNYMRELRMVYHSSTNTSSLLPTTAVDRDYGELAEDDVPGTADVVIVGFWNAGVYDYKTGRHPVFADNNSQLLHLGLMVSQTLAQHAHKFSLGIQQLGSYGKWRNDVWEVDSFDLEAHAERVQESTKKARIARLAVLEDKDPIVTPGEHCTWCPARGVCPEWR